MSQIVEKTEIRLSVTQEIKDRFGRIKVRRGGTRSGYTMAILRPALDIEELGGDAVRILETAREQLEAARAGRTQFQGLPTTAPDEIEVLR